MRHFIVMEHSYEKDYQIILVRAFLKWRGCILVFIQTAYILHTLIQFKY